VALQFICAAVTTTEEWHDRSRKLPQPNARVKEGNEFWTALYTFLHSLTAYTSKPHSLHPENGGSEVLRNVGILQR